MCRLLFCSVRAASPFGALSLFFFGRRGLKLVMLVTVTVALSALVTACGNKGDLYLIEPEVLLPVDVVENPNSPDAANAADAALEELDEEALAERRRRASGAPDEPAQQNTSGTD